MINIQTINKSQLKGKIGEIVPINYRPQLGENVFTVFLDGQVPVKIRSKLTKSEFDKLCR